MTNEQQAQAAIREMRSACNLMPIYAAEHSRKNMEDLAAYLTERCDLLERVMQQHTPVDVSESAHAAAHRTAHAPRPEYHIDEKKVQVVMCILRRYEQPQTQREVEDTLCPDYGMDPGWQRWLDSARPSELASWIMGRFADSRLAPSDNSK